jgi:hypothetical protein
MAIQQHRLNNYDKILDPINLVYSTMKKQDVPQDNSRTYGGHKKVIYATNNIGQYETVESSGWETEQYVTLMAVEELNELTLAAYSRVKEGLCSPLEYHMYAQRFDTSSLAQATGFFQWQVKRHLKPTIFSKLSESKIQRYLTVFRLTANELKSIPDQPPQI